MSYIDELVDFLQPDQRGDLRNATSASVVKLTGDVEGLETVCKSDKLIKAIVSLAKDADIFVSKDVMRVLVNVSSYEIGVRTLLDMEELCIVEKMVELIIDSEYHHADFACGVLCNLSRTPEMCRRVLLHITKTETGLEGLVHILCQINYNKHGAKFHFIAALMSNIAQINEGRCHLMNKEKCIFERLLPFTQYFQSEGRRKSIIAAIHNCSFQKEYHEWLLGDDIEVASHLCMSLAGPDVFTTEENDSLPLDLQYLPDDKTREPSKEIRILILETLIQLCATKVGRAKLRDCNIYLILREHHKWEENEKCVSINEDVVNLLVRTEEEIGYEDLTTIEIPPDLSTKFTDEDIQQST